MLDADALQRLRDEILIKKTQYTKMLPFFDASENILDFEILWSELEFLIKKRQAWSSFDSILTTVLPNVDARQIIWNYMDTGLLVMDSSFWADSFQHWVHDMTLKIPTYPRTSPCSFVIRNGPPGGDRILTYCIPKTKRWKMRQKWVHLSGQMMAIAPDVYHYTHTYKIFEAGKWREFNAHWMRFWGDSSYLCWILSVVFGLSLPIDEMFNSFILIADCFRQNCLQAETLNWTEVGTHSSIAVEKCNRVCKGKTKIVDRRPRCIDSVNVADLETLRIAMRCPQTVDAKYLSLFEKDINLAKAVAALSLRQSIKRYQLPRNIAQIQEEAAWRRLQSNTMPAYHRLFVYMCLRCMHVTNNVKKSMRIKSSHTFVCSICKSGEFILKVNTVGCIVQIGKNLFYNCNRCENIHEWSCNGMNFSHCERSEGSMNSVYTRTCSMCTRSINLTAFNVLNEEVGIISRLLLCSKHMPLQQHLSTIYNYDSFFDALHMKQKLYGHKNNYKII